MHPAPSQTRRFGIVAWLGIALVAGLVTERWMVLVHARPTDFDDAYMYLRYAHNVLAGHGLAWNPGEGAVYGVTSLLHFAVVTKLCWLFGGLDGAGVLRVASGSAAIAFMAALVALAALGSRQPKLRGNWILWSAVLLPLVAFREAFAFHAGTGMDTMLSALANAFLAFSIVQLGRSKTRSVVVLATIAGLVAVLARPDNLLCALLGPALALLFPRPRWRQLASFAALSLASLAMLVAIVWWKLGSPVPLSFFAKQPWYYGGFAGEFTWNPFLFLKVFAYSAWLFVVALILFADRAGWKRAVVLLAPASASILVLFRFNQIMGHLGRFYYPFLPFFVAAGVLEFDAWLGRVHAGQALVGRALFRRVCIAALAVLVGSLSLSVAAGLYGARASAQRLETPGGYRVAACTDLPDIDSWQAAHAIAALAQAAPLGTSFAMSEHGLPGALAPNATIIDLLGLHDPYFARHGFSAVELFRRKPDVIWLPHEDHTQMLRDLLGSDELWTHYAVYPDAFFHGLAVRSDGPHAAELAERVAQQWARTYPGTVMADYRAVRER
jgi:hypothetical protein